MGEKVKGLRSPDGSYRAVQGGKSSTGNAGKNIVIIVCGARRALELVG